MERLDSDEDENLRRMQRYEWLCEVIEGAVREADAYRRLQDELRRRLIDERADHPPDRPAA
jgi:hypothetical protein